MVASCSSSSSDGPATSSGGTSSGGASGSSGSSGSGSPGTPLNATSTREQRNALCNEAVPKCHSYPNVGACIDDHQSAGACFVTTVLDCVKKLGAACGEGDYDACQGEGASACDAVSVPTYVTECKDKNASCKSTYPPAEADDIAQNIDDSCSLLRALDESGRALGARCLTGSCAELEKCLVELTP